MRRTAAAGVKAPSGSLAAAWQRGKPESSPAPGNESAAVCTVPATGQLIDFAAIAEHQLSCPATLQASKSFSLQLQAVEVMGGQPALRHIDRQPAAADTYSGQKSGF